jgi:multidrug transporter EmrE-like cation transporter
MNSPDICNPKPAPFSAYAALALTALLSTTAEMFFKKGAIQTANLPSVIDWFGVTALASWWVWPGMLLQILGMVSYASSLRRLPLYVAFSFMSVLHVLIPVGSLLFFNEQISLRRWSGIALVLGGIWIIARPVSRIEEEIKREL